MKSFPRLVTKEFIACIADNSPLGIHRGGYNGIAALIPRQTGNNIFVPTFAGLNYETISLSGLPPYTHPSGSKFEPRCEPMQIEQAGNNRVVLAQPATSRARVSARIAFSAQEPCYLHQRIELVFHRRFCPNEEKNSFRSLWASYIHMPSDRHVYLKADAGQDLAGWIGVTKEDHSADEFLIRPLPADREIEAAEHLSIMTTAQNLTREKVSPQVWAPSEAPSRLAKPLPFYYGLCDGGLLFLMLFRQPERFRFAYSPCGAGKQPAWNPAWDYVLHLDDVELEKTYRWDLCLAVKEYRGRRDILREVRRYHESQVRG